MRMPRSPFLTLRPSWFHVHRAQQRGLRSGFCRGNLQNVAEAVVVKPAHGGEVGGEGFRVSLLQLLLIKGLHVGRDYFFRGLLLLLVGVLRWTVVTAAAVSVAVAFMGASSLVLAVALAVCALNAGAVACTDMRERLLAKAGVARRNGEGDLPPLEWSTARMERAKRSEGCTSEARKPGETPCAARSGQSP